MVKEKTKELKKKVRMKRMANNNFDKDMKNTILIIAALFAFQGLIAQDDKNVGSVEITVIDQ